MPAKYSPDGACKMVWNICDNLRIGDTAPDFGTVEREALKLKIHGPTAKAQYYYWSKFHGLKRIYPKRKKGHA